ncbi:hypothetical protein HanOQP8_Chr07g0259711 [Helianthus annuus]|nr:hypothetical protein HanOQP8_Chr07g0259711 [Helianthus annuus]
MCRRHRTKGLRTILLKLGIVERLCYRPTKLSLGFLNWLPICFSLIKKVILIRLMLWGLLMMLLILFERFLFALSFGLIFLCLYNIKVIYLHSSGLHPTSDNKHPYLSSTKS